SSSLLVLVEVRFPQNCVVLVSGVVVLPSGLRCIAWLLVFWLRCIAWLPCVLVMFSRTVCCGLDEDFSQDYLVFNGALVVLVEVIPGPACIASAVLLAAVFSLMVRVVWPFGLCVLVKVLPRIAPCHVWWRTALSAFGEGSPQSCPVSRCGALTVCLAVVLARLSSCSFFEFLDCADGTSLSL
ncbi:hypothetical protein Taro_019390, partial [Colocasia esculenta]|nr:hypothetical protein [Colocasia esculenta]